MTDGHELPPGEPVLDADASSSLAGAALALARRFAAGATMWCVAPRCPEHARHVAVEFVHPVIVGTRALPAVSLEIADAHASLRTCSRPGDVLLVLGDASDEQLGDLVRRAPVWGLTTVWVGAGERPPPGAADHVLWVGGSGTARHDGRLVLVYHLLWELTHVCFEHPGLLDEPSTGGPGAEAAGAGQTCVTCSDEGRPAEVLVNARSGEAVTVRSARGTETVDATLVGPVQPGDLLLVHAGTAIARLDAPVDRDGPATITGEARRDGDSG
jgi:hydrogenase maturation factor